MVLIYLSLVLAYAVPLFAVSEDRYPAMTRQALMVVFAAFVIFIAFPTQSGFPPGQEMPPGVQPLFALLHAVDRPYNLVPSLHVAGAAVVLLASAEATTRFVGHALRAWLALICVSTLFVHQHHLVDIAAGLLLALLARRLFPLPAVAR
jgi:membrane-associated phospholipid phosphatase